MDPTEQVARLYERTEAEAAKASERLVGSGGFSALLGQMAENAAALTKLGADSMDLVLRNLRVAGRRDIVRLGRQLARTEDKLERVLQEVEALRDRLEALGEPTDGADPRSAGSRANNANAGRRSSAGASRARTQAAKPRGEGSAGK
jgi:hypothetical protein